MEDRLKSLDLPLLFKFRRALIFFQDCIIKQMSNGQFITLDNIENFARTVSKSYLAQRLRSFAK